VQLGKEFTIDLDKFIRKVPKEDKKSLNLKFKKKLSPEYEKNPFTIPEDIDLYELSPF
jgi:hypothetical protein